MPPRRDPGFTQFRDDLLGAAMRGKVQPLDAAERVVRVVPTNCHTDFQITVTIADHLLTIHFEGYS